MSLIGISSNFPGLKLSESVGSIIFLGPFGSEAPEWVRLETFFGLSRAEVSDWGELKTFFWVIPIESFEFALNFSDSVGLKLSSYFLD